MASLRTAGGERKYLTEAEHGRFLAAADKAPPEERAFCHVLGWTGCRISEGMALTPERLEYDEKIIVFETLKRRQRGIYRAVPVPDELLTMLDLVFNLGHRPAATRRERLWTWSRTTAWRRVHAVLEVAGIAGPHATSRGLRHAFGVGSVGKGVPLPFVKTWLGHAQLSTTEIYVDAVGEEERAIAARRWRRDDVPRAT